MKNLNQIDLNLLVYLEVLLRERNVTQAANQLGLSQPAMSNGLRRLRALFDDPLLVRTSEGMTPTGGGHALRGAHQQWVVKEGPQSSEPVAHGGL